MQNRTFSFCYDQVYRQRPFQNILRTGFQYEPVLSITACVIPLLLQPIPQSLQIRDIGPKPNS